MSNYPILKSIYEMTDSDDLRIQQMALILDEQCKEYISTRATLISTMEQEARYARQRADSLVRDSDFAVYRGRYNPVGILEAEVTCRVLYKQMVFTCSALDISRECLMYELVDKATGRA
jgi:hypothetical protein